jgi:hypothetical protein
MLNLDKPRANLDLRGNFFPVKSCEQHGFYTREDKNGEKFETVQEAV